MAWSVLQSASGVTTAATNTLTVTYTAANVSAGTKLIAAITCSTNTGFTVTSVQDAALNSMTQVGFLDDTTNAVGVALYAMDTPAGDVGIKPAIKVTISTASGDISMVVLEVSGLATGNTLAAMIDGGALAAHNSGAGAASWASGAYSSTAASEFLIAVGADNGGPEVVAQPSGYTLDPGSVNNNSLGNCLVAYKNSASGAEAGTWTVTSGTQTGWANLLTAFKVAAGGGGVAVAAPKQRPQSYPRVHRRALVGGSGLVGDGTNVTTVNAPAPSGKVPPAAQTVYRRGSRQLNAIAGPDRSAAAAGGQRGTPNAAPAAPVNGTVPAHLVIGRRAAGRVLWHGTVTRTVNAVPPVNGTPPPLRAVFSRRRTGRAVWGGVTGPQPAPPGLVAQELSWRPRRVPSRALWAGTVTRTVNATPATPVNGTAPAHLVVARRSAGRALWRGTVTRTANAVPAPPVNGTVPPHLMVARRTAARVIWRGGAGPALPAPNGTVPRYLTVSRRTSARGVWRGNAVPLLTSPPATGGLVRRRRAERARWSGTVTRTTNAPPPPFTPGILTAYSAPAAVLTAGTQRTGGPS